MATPKKWYGPEDIKWSAEREGKYIEEYKLVEIILSKSDRKNIKLKASDLKIRVGYRIERDIAQ